MNCKKMISVIALSLFSLTMTACSATPNNSEPTSGESITSTVIESTASITPESTDGGLFESGEGSKILIAYFTVPETDGVDAVAQASRVVKNGEKLGNTEYIAGIIRDTPGGDLFKIETAQEYPGSHSPLLDFAYDEKNNNARPELSSHIENFDEYDVVFVGYPNWNADFPMPLYTFFEEYDFGGKTIIPFVTHGGSGFSSTVRTIKSLGPNAVVTENNFSVSRNSVPDAERDAIKWAESLIAE